MPRCPACFVPMTRIEEQGLRAHMCGKCMGMWISPVAMLRRVRMDVAAAQAQTPRAAGATDAPPSNAAASASPPAGALPPQPAAAAPADSLDNAPPLAELAATVTQADHKKSLRCPECEKPMAKDRFQQMIPVTLDRCKRCDHIWLDRGKYNLIRRLYVEMMLSTDPQIVQLREKIAHATAAWDNRSTLSNTVPGSAASISNAGSMTGFTISTIINLLSG